MNGRLPDPLSSLPPPATDRAGSGPAPRWRFAVAPLAALLALTAVLAFAFLYLRYAHAVPRPSPPAAQAAAPAGGADAGGAVPWPQQEPQQRPQRRPQQEPQREAAPPPPPPPPSAPPAPGKAAQAQRATAPSPPRASRPLPRPNGAAPSSGADWLRAGYRAYRRQALDAAAAAYGNVLHRASPGARQRREALLGAAAVAWRQGKEAEARRRYRQLLRRSPEDPAALAGLAALRRDADGPATALPALAAAAAAATHPAPLHFALGGLYAARGRWPEAARAYRKSCRAEPRPDCLFNLAVSLDRLRRRRESLRYYRQALAAARERPAVFAAGAARARIRQLQRQRQTP